MKVKPPSPGTPFYPALPKIAALVAVSCAMSACQRQPEPQQEQYQGPPGLPPISQKSIPVKGGK